jgi:vacuolar protein sorting-associated protein 13A/C
MSSSHNAFGLQIEDMPWERLRNLSVDREGDFAYPLRPRKDRIGHRLVCDVKVKDNVKIVTFRSSMKIENMTHLPMELTLLDKDNKATGRVYKIRELARSDVCEL